MRKCKKADLNKIFKIILAVMLFVASINFALGSPNNVPVCAKEIKGHVRCMSYVIADAQNKVKPIVLPLIGGPYGPKEFLSAYNLGSGTTNTPKTIVVVDAYDQSNIFSDLTTYSNHFGIPPLKDCAVSPTAFSCFQKVDQRGGTNYPKPDLGWGLEISLDTEGAHGICQNCNILLVEADSSSYDDIMQAFDRGIAMGGNIVSNSYGSAEMPDETSYDSHFNLPGKAIVFSSGDSGYGASYPAASPYVTSVGGTTLQLNPRKETLWSYSGSGCSAYEPKPQFQRDTGCGKKTIADVAADGDPATGAAVYDSSYGGWFQVGGTSLSAPIIAGVFALGKGFSDNVNSIPYTNVNYGVNLYDVTSGSNGACSIAYLCTAGPGYDGPTGLGSPIGTGAFETAQITTGITVSSPNGGESWLTGSTKTISWSYTGNAGSTVKIDLYKSGSLNKVLATGVAIGNGGAGSYNWNIDPSTIAGSDYQIKVTTDLGITDLSNAAFAIGTVQPPASSVTVVSPNGGEKWRRGTAHTISWTKTGSPGTYVKIELLKAGVLNRVISSSKSGTSYIWTIPYSQTSGTDYKIRITSTSNSVYKDTSNNNFNIVR